MMKFQHLLSHVLRNRSDHMNSQSRICEVAQKTPDRIERGRLLRRYRQFAGS